MKCAHIRALLLRQIPTALFVYLQVVSRHSISMKIDFPLTLMVYHRKISAFIRKQNALANWASIKDSIYKKKHFKNVISNSVLNVEAKPVKFWTTENTANFQIKLIRRVIYCIRVILCSTFYKVRKFHVRTTKLRNFIKV